MMEEKLSIIVPVYNSESTVERCISSIMSQTEKDFRIYVVDDCSIDGSRKKLQNIAKNNNRISLYKTEKNSGPSVARNIALNVAKGKWVSFVDSDDYIDCNYYTNLINAAENKNADICISSFIQVDINGDIIAKHMAKLEYEANTTEQALYVAYGGVDDLEFAYNLCCNKIFKRQLFSEIKFPEGRLQEDAYVMPFLIYAAKNGITIAPNAIYYYVDNYLSISHMAQDGARDLKRREDLLFLYQQHINLYKKNKSRLYLRSQSNYLHNAIAIYKLHYGTLKRKYADDFDDIYIGFKEVYKDAKRNNNPFISKKLDIVFRIFIFSPSIYLKLF